MRPFRAHLHVLLAAFVVLLATTAANRAHYFCKMMGSVVEECCCADDSGPPEAHPEYGPAARAPGCCERLISPAQPTLVQLRDGAPGLPTAAVVALLPVPEALAPTFRVVDSTTAVARAPPAIGPPLFLAHCALLI